MRIGICGLGHVGNALQRFFRRSGENEVFLFDKFIRGVDSPAHQDAVNTADLVFIAVPTPPGASGTCDTKHVEEAVSWISTPICIKSTTSPGTVERLIEHTRKPIVFSPEFIGESAAHPWNEVDSAGILIVGGEASIADLVIRAYSTCARPGLRIATTTARTAELCKYMDNSFLATKVAFVNQFFDVATALGVDFEELRRLWLMDPRIGESHSSVTIDRGFSGKCLPKDILALVSLMETRGGAPLLQAVLEYNRSLIPGRTQP